MPNVIKYDPEALNQALADLAQAATVARVAVICEDWEAARAELHKAITALAKAVYQFSIRR